MATITEAKAAKLLLEAVKKAAPDDLAEYYNELFPQEPTNEAKVKEDPDAALARVVRHIEKGLLLEEILDLWNVVFPGQGSAWFDEEDGLIHYGEARWPATWAE